MSSPSTTSILQLLGVALAALLGNAAAHRGLLPKGACDGDFGNSSSALLIPQPSISWAMKHYSDCSNRAVWMNFVNPSDNFKFYVGAGVPPVQRFKGLRVDAVIIGPGLAALSAADMASLPDGVRNDPVWSTAGVGAILHRSPADQSTCKHLGAVMNKECKVVNGRCDFYEPYGKTHSWRVLDADENVIPEAGKTYHVAVWLQQATSGKFGVAVGTWVEDFRTPYKIETPSCTRDLTDFSEKGANDLACFPNENCTGLSPPISRTSCVARGVGAGSDKKPKPTPPKKPTCALGAVCPAWMAGCTTPPVCGMCAMPMNKYKVSMGCGAEQCPNAGKLWDMVNMKMHKGMALNFTGNPELDFVRGMIPHHIGAVDMCHVLLSNLTCTAWDELSGLGGMVHFCNHAKKEQEREVGGMQAWLTAKGFDEEAPCDMNTNTNTNTGSKGGMNMGRRNLAGMGGMGGMGGMKMSDGCGAMKAPSSVKNIKANRDMHAGMAIKFSCDHTIDFVRGMMPHHAGAVAMCDVMLSSTTTAPDAYLTALCKNITRTQRAEVAWMAEWLAARGKKASALCHDKCNGGAAPTQPPQPCDDMLSTSSFCHSLGDCDCAKLTKKHACGNVTYKVGFGLMNISSQCQRTCGMCAGPQTPLFHDACNGTGAKITKATTTGAPTTKAPTTGAPTVALTTAPTTMEPRGVVTTTFPGTLDDLSTAQKTEFKGQYKKAIAASSSSITESDIVAVTLKAGSIVASATLKPSVPTETVTALVSNMKGAVANNTMVIAVSGGKSFAATSTESVYEAPKKSTFRSRVKTFLNGDKNVVLSLVIFICLILIMFCVACYFCGKSKGKGKDESSA